MIVRNLSVLRILLIGSILGSTLISCGSVENPLESLSSSGDGNYSSSVATETSSNSSGGNNSNNYKTINIGNQTWMAENLNYAIQGSKCYNNDPENCKKYGRLYNWETALKACPSGWHLPSDAEWKVLTDYLGGNPGDKLKARGWNSYDNATDDYGFSALPGGFGFPDGSFNDVGDYGYWWSATERNSDYAYNRDMWYISSYVSRSDIIKSRLLSVRCVKN